MTSTSPHPRLDLVEQFTHPIRLSIAAGLSGVERLEFKAVRDAVQVSDSVLSRQVSQLEDAGVVGVEKGFVGKRPRTWLSLTAHGRTLLTQHLDALHRITVGP